jgi:hypothetical protein
VKERRARFSCFFPDEKKRRSWEDAANYFFHFRIFFERLLVSLRADRLRCAEGENLNMKVTSLAAAVFAVFLSGCSGGDTSAKSGNWQPDPTLLDQLAPAVAVEGYEIRPPKAYQLQRPPGPEAGRFFFWIGSPRPNQTAPKLGLTLTTLPPDEAKEYTLEKFLSLHLELFKKQTAGWSQTATERGQLNGLSFLRVRFNGESTKDLKMHGFLYMAQDGANFIELISRDVEPFHVEALKLAETAARTFRKR